MQVKELTETENSVENPGKKSDEADEKKPSDEKSVVERDDIDSILDVSAKVFDFPLLEGVEKSVEALYFYKNVFNLIPRGAGSLKYLRTLKFFANELNLFPGEFNDLDGLECLQVKVAQAPGLGGLDFGKLKALKELELSRVPLRPSAFPVLSELAGLKCLTKLSVCHFSIRFLPPEIGRLNKLEYLDLSFNKMKKLPTEITFLNSLVSLKVANNKLFELPSGLSSLQKLENLDLSNNRLTSFGFLELESMHNLQRLDLQYNKLLSCCQIPSWICCNLEGNGNDLSNDEFISSAAEMDGVECVVEEPRDSGGSSTTSLNHSSGSSPSNKCFAARKSKGWKRRYSLQQRARRERLNNSRKWKGQNFAAIHKTTEKCLTCRDSDLVDDSFVESSCTTVVPEVDNKELFSGGVDTGSSIENVDNQIVLKKDYCEKKCSCDALECRQHLSEIESACTKHETASLLDASSMPDDCLYSEVCSSISKCKRHSDAELDNPKPRKYRRPTGNQSDTSSQYSRVSFCGVDDYLSDGFYDAGRDRPFMPLSVYEKNLQLESREVILVDRERDEKLDVIVLCAQALVSRFRQINGLLKERGHEAIDSLQIASLLAIFVSDHFGGSDKSAVLQKTRKAVSGSNYRKPFVCTCPTGNDDRTKRITKDSLDGVEDIVFLDLCERALQSLKARRNSVVVPIGSLQFGVCRHRALLMKYLCDRVEPPIPCELVRGFLDFSPHAWNVISVKRGQLWVRMIVDACHPHDIREETDPEFFCRYVPLTRMTVSARRDDKSSMCCSFPSLSAYDQIGKTASTTLLECKVGSVEAAAKVRKLEVCGMSADEIRSFELNCLGEARMLGSLKHSCIIKYYGHQISSKWSSSSDRKSDIRILQSAILMEYIKGGSLKLYLEKLARDGDKHVPVVLALFIARDVACALTELHSRHIIHRDIKSENVLIDLEEKRDDGSPVVKLCDFDRAIPLRSSLHSCCIAHTGIPPPDVCVGTPRWMAPEVFRTMNRRDMYGLEVDIWSFGCLLAELLTLRIPYSDLPETDIHSFLEVGKRPHLTEELEELTGSNREWEDLVMAQLESEPKGSENESSILKILVALYYWCTESNVKDRPTAKKLYKLLAHASSTFGSKSLEQE